MPVPNPEEVKAKTQGETLAASQARSDKEASGLAKKLGLTKARTSDRAEFKALFGGKRTRQRASYPVDIITRENFYVRFEAVERIQANRKSPVTKTGLYSCNLPMPADISTAYAQSYTNVESLLGDVDTSSTVGVVKGLVQGAVKGIAKGVGQSATQAMGLQMGLAVNPHMAVLFQGTEFRSHQFAYKLTALSQEDAQVIQEIVKAFKYFSAPILTPTTYNFPDEWMITFMSGQGPMDTLFTIGRSVLKNVSVKYGTESSPVFTRDDHPLTIEIGLEFQETELVTKQQIGENY